jgi:hypothetical protein
MFDNLAKENEQFQKHCKVNLAIFVSLPANTRPDWKQADKYTDQLHTPYPVAIEFLTAFHTSFAREETDYNMVHFSTLTQVI